MSEVLASLLSSRNSKVISEAKDDKIVVQLSQPYAATDTVDPRWWIKRKRFQLVNFTELYLAKVLVILSETRRGPAKFWRVQQYLRFSWGFRGRKRTCYRIGMRYIHKALVYATKGRLLKKIQMHKLWNMRLDAAAQEHNLTGHNFLEGLARCNIQLDRKVLTDLAVFEPRTFQSLVEVSKKRLEEEGIANAQMPRPQGVFTRGML
ncbi:39S ribosomal protein L20, mitochondrial [Lamellibrachia satsuma]|nr:39S ribosomal protein L20, mitochondrial [Lamellibrachia satsuma]